MAMPKKRKRTVTACTECHRRKQKCDRKKPCNICIARNVEDKCTYEHEATYVKPSPSEDKNIIQFVQEQQEDEDENIDKAAKPVDLSEQTGYSFRTDSNVLVGLQKSLDGTNEVSTNRTRPSGSMLVTYLKGKFCNIVAQLPHDPALSDILEWFFKEANLHAEVLERFYFIKLYNAWRHMNESITKNSRLEGASRELLYFPALLFQTLAVGMQYLPLDSPVARSLNLKTWSELDALSEKYTQLGSRLMNLLGRHSSTITAVQHDLVRAFWLKNSSRGLESWYALGDAIRQAQDLGLHLQADVQRSDNLEETLERLWYDEYKRRLWVSLFNWDAHTALVLGRPRTINAADCTIKPPLDCNMPLDPTKTVPATTGPTDLPSTFTRHWWQYQLSYKIHEMLSLGADKRYVKDYQTVTKLHDEVLALLDLLPPVTRPKNTDHSWDVQCPYIPQQREQILSAANSYLIALHRPHAAIHDESRAAALQAALNVLDSQERLFNLLSSNHHGTYGTAFYTVDAALFLASLAMEKTLEDATVDTRVDNALQQSLYRLNLIKYRNPMAESGLKLLTRCYEAVQAKQAKNNSGPGPTDMPDFFSSALPSSAAVPKLVSPIGNNMSTVGDMGYDSGAFDWDLLLPGNNNMSMNLDAIGNLTDFSASFWTEQMSQLMNATPGVPDDDTAWGFWNV